MVEQHYPAVVWGHGTLRRTGLAGRRTGRVMPRSSLVGRPFDGAVTARCWTVCLVPTVVVTVVEGVEGREGVLPPTRQVTSAR